MRGPFPELRPHIETIARALLGEPNRQLSTRQQLRFGSNGSVSVEITGPKCGQWYDHEAQQGGGPWKLLTVKGGMANGAVVEWLRSKLGIEIPYASQGARDPVVTYDYRDERGDLLYQVCRFEPKDFRFRRPDGKGGWIWSIKGLRRVPYRLPDLLAAPADCLVFIVEGEKDTDRLASLGLVATCNPGGAAKRREDGKPAKPKWPAAFAPFFKDRHVVILPDNDEAGRDHVEAITRNLASVAALVRVVDLAEDYPNLPPKGDVSDWLDAGGTGAELQRLVEEAPAFAQQDRADIAQPDDATPPQFSDEALALEFSDKHAAELRYVASFKRWHIWSGSHWRADDTMQAFDFARAVCRSAAALVPPERKRIAFAVAAATTVAAVERLARADRRHATTAAQWDPEAWIFNTPRKIDLRTGIEYAPRHEDYCTKIAAVAPAHIATPIWRTFLDRITAGNPELQNYLQRMAGYCMTGDTSEHVLFFLHGSGANGKSVFINTLRAIWGDYACVAPMTTFMASHTDQHPTDLAMLRGVRLVVAQETEVGRQWAEAKIKAITGGGPVRARFMRQDFFEYTPQFKLVIVGNHKPALRSVDEAMRRRIHLVPFIVTIPPEERERELLEKLKPEWPGILQWAVAGCLEWQKIGLAPPPAVGEATKEYLAEEDALARWIEECCDTGKHLWGIGAKLWSNWKAWSEANNELTGTRKQFAQGLKDRGFTPSKSQEVRGYVGLGLKPTAERDRADLA
jgi:putative DNA primase/helicase